VYPDGKPVVLCIEEAVRRTHTRSTRTSTPSAASAVTSYSDLCVRVYILFNYLMQRQQQRWQHQQQQRRLQQEQEEMMRKAKRYHAQTRKQLRLQQPNL